MSWRKHYEEPNATVATDISDLWMVEYAHYSAKFTLNNYAGLCARRSPDRPTVNVLKGEVKVGVVVLVVLVLVEAPRTSHRQRWSTRPTS